jgi:predicted aldo/keto reductase-like oxidoreductase
MSSESKELTRRRFLSATATGLVGAGLVGLSPRGLRAEEPPAAPAEPVPGKILTRPFGKTGLVLPLVSMGVMNNDNPDILKASYDLGVRHFDSAAAYMNGNNERMVGRVIKEMGIRRDVVVATKIFTPNYRESTAPADVPARIRSLCEESLERLQMDHVDILYVHNLKETGIASSGPIIETMQALKKEGKTRFIGVTTHTRMHEIIDEAVATGAWDVIETAFNFTMADYGELLEAIDNAATQGVAVVAMKTQAGSSRRSQIDFGDRYSNRTIATAALKWVLRNPSVATAIPGYATFEHMREDFSVAYGLDYDEDEKRLLGERNIKVGMGFCRQCQVCLDTCPRGADVPSLMRTHMYAARYSNFAAAREVLGEIPAGRGVEACRSCASCAARCANAVDIAGKVAELQRMYA